MTGNGSPNGEGFEHGLRGIPFRPREGGWSERMVGGRAAVEAELPPRGVRGEIRLAGVVRAEP